MANTANAILEIAIDGRVVDALAEAGIDKLDADTLEFEDEANEGIDHVRIYTR